MWRSCGAAKHAWGGVNVLPGRHWEEGERKCSFPQFAVCPSRTMNPRHRIVGLLVLVASLAPTLAADPVNGKLTQQGTPEPPLVGAPVIPQQLSPLPVGPANCPPQVCAPPPRLVVDCPVEPPTPLVSLKVRAEACTTMNQEITYRIRVCNQSAAFAHHVLIRNPLPANVRYVRASPEPHQKEPEIQWKLNTLAPGACCDLTLVLAATNTDDVKNCTRVAFEHGQCVTTRQVRLAPGVPGAPPVVEEKGGTGQEPRIVPVPQPGVGPAKLQLDVSGPKQQYANLPSKFLITVRNSGAEAATNVLVTAVLPEQADYVSSSAGGRFHAQQVAWILGRVDGGATRTVEVTMRAKAAGDLCIKAKVFADSGIEVSAEACTRFAGQSALTMDTIDTKDPVEVDSQTSYTIRITNQGQVTITNLKLLALIPAEMQLVRAIGPSDPPPVDALPKRQEGKLPVAFKTLKELAPGAQVTYEVFVKALKVGDVRFRVELRADQLDSGQPVIEEESTLLFADPERVPPRVGGVGRKMTR